MKYIITGNELRFSLKKKDTGFSTTKYSLFYTKKAGDYWLSPFKGKVAASLIDTGNYVTVKTGKKEITLDYAQIEYLQVLFNELMPTKITTLEGKK